MKMKHNNKGFSLVELIVVIAIMAILGGVGTAGYTKYIEQTNKKADMALVGNIMRAIETGTNSTMYNLDDSMTVGGISYPVGYVVLSTSANAQSNASNIQANEVNDTCAFVEENIISIEKTNKTYSCSSFLCPGTKNGDIYKQTPKTIRYCTTHSKNPPIHLTENTLYPTAYKLNHSGSLRPSHSLTTSDSFTLSAGSYVAENGVSQLYKEYSEGKCVFAANNGVIADNIITNAEGKNPIYEALEAAYGENVAGTNLKYDKWLIDEKANYTTFLNSTGKMIDSIEDTYDDLEIMLGIIRESNEFGITNIDTSNYLSADYLDASQLLESFSAHLINKHDTESKWMDAWNNAASYTGVDYTYGMTEPGKYHHDYVYSATKSYNQCFASYCEANGVDPTYTQAILEFTSTPNESGLEDMALLNTIPRTVNTAAFNGITGRNTDYTLQNKFRNISNSDTDTQADAAFNQCKELYKSYIDNSNGESPCQKNGKAFYGFMDIMNKTAGAARDNDNISEGNFFGYYNNYLNAMSAIYEGVETATKDGNIVIIVTVKDGIVTCEVSPSAANPRNK